MQPLSNRDFFHSSQENYTALHMACMYSRDDVVKYLLTKQADVSILGGPKSQTCVHLAAGRMTGQTLQVVRELLKMCPRDVRMMPDLDGNIPLFVAIETGSINVCKELLTMDTEDQIRRLKVHEAVRLHVCDISRNFYFFPSASDASNGHMSSSGHEEERRRAGQAVH